MGIPKFFRYIAQRWPLTSQLVNGNVIPEFDNLYLDMNSIIHMNTHANMDNVGNLNEDEVFLAVTNYIEHLFSVIEPKQYFVLAIDGVAPRAKMNQQRSRRFRSALDAENQRRKAAERGEELDEDPFDSNCITPGTEFMMHLTTHLKYFISRKMTEDTKWQNCKIVLSGHEVPGEGEHKIMEFIRNLRSQPGYNVNTRHCLYGLDADLIMLGLSTHEPHFSLLREEVTFGHNKVTSNELCDIRFNLLHISLVREYIELELMSGASFKEKPDFERVLDDLILILFVIGNDFLPELPMLLVHDGAIPVIFDTYKAYLTQSHNRYLTLNGVIDFQALKQWLEHLKSYQVRKFEQQCALDNWFSSEMDKVTTDTGDKEDEIVLTSAQSELFRDIKKFMRKCISKNDHKSTLECNVETKFVALLASQTGFSYENNVLQYIGGDVDAEMALRVLRIYSVAEVHEERDMEDYSKKFTDWKNRYYRHKFKDSYDSEVVRKVSTRYLEGLQWVLLYYYHSCPSWSWYYDNHYSTMTTELISAIDDDFKPEFDLGTPFTPFEQLMSVLPDRSSALVPVALRHLMLEENSPLKSFYPHSFELDKNGKKADWEAVVLIPFIDEKLMLKYVAPIEETQLTEDEKRRNATGINLEFEYNPSASHFYRSPSRLQPDLQACTCVSHALRFQKHQLRFGLLKGSKSGINSLAGFPSLFTLKFNWKLLRDFGVKVFEMPSRDDSVIIQLKPAQDRIKTGDIVYVNWPFLTEARVAVVKSPEPNAKWYRDAQKSLGDYKRAGVDLGPTKAFIGVEELDGLVRNTDGSYQKEFSETVTFYPVQTVVTHVNHEDPRFMEKDAFPLEEEFPVDSLSLVLLPKFYGFPAIIKNYDNGALDVEITSLRKRDPIIDSATRIVAHSAMKEQWFSTEYAAKILGVDVRTLLNLSARFVCLNEDKKKINIGLRLRLPIDSMMAKGYCCTDDRNRWYFSPLAIDLIKAYLQKFRPVLKKVANPRSVLDNKTCDEIKDFIKKNFPTPMYIPVSNRELNPNAIKEVEQLLVDAEPAHLERIIIKGLDRNALLSPKHAHHQLRYQQFNFGDRVVFALDHGKVPLFTRGVVAGVIGTNYANATLNVIWDFELLSGSTLNNALTTKRGLNVPASSILNLTQPQLKFFAANAPKVTRISAKADMTNTLTQKLIEKENAKTLYKPAQAPMLSAWKGQTQSTKPDGQIDPASMSMGPKQPITSNTSNTGHANETKKKSKNLTKTSKAESTQNVMPVQSTGSDVSEGSSVPMHKERILPKAPKGPKGVKGPKVPKGPKGVNSPKDPNGPKGTNVSKGSTKRSKGPKRAQESKKLQVLENVEDSRVPSNSVEPHVIASSEPASIDPSVALGKLSLEGRRNNVNAKKLLAAINRPSHSSA